MRGASGSFLRDFDEPEPFEPEPVPASPLEPLSSIFVAGSNLLSFCEFKSRALLESPKPPLPFVPGRPGSPRPFPDPLSAGANVFFCQSSFGGGAIVLPVGAPIPQFPELHGAQATLPHGSQPQGLQPQGSQDAAKAGRHRLHPIGP